MHVHSNLVLLGKCKDPNYAKKHNEITTASAGELSSDEDSELEVDLTGDAAAAAAGGENEDEDDAVLAARPPPYA